MNKNKQTVSATPEGLERAKRALKRLFETQLHLADALKGLVGRSTIQKFFQSQEIQVDKFKEICNALTLELQWEAIAGLMESSNLVDLPDSQSSKQALEEQDSSININALVEEIREKVKPHIKERCSKMRVLDMAQPIKLTGKQGIYTSVNILDQITGRQRLAIAELLQKCNTEEELDRFSLSHVIKERVPGLQAVEQHSKLMVLGKPGAGKTTFLKYLAMQCIEGLFQNNQVPWFITLKDFAESSKEPNLLEYTAQQLLSYGVTDASEKVSQLLRHGKAFILLDGLDEVREDDTERVLQQIQDFSNEFHTNQFVITCRIAAKEYTFEQFTEVEVADFDDKQIKTFVTKWFQHKKDNDASKQFMQQLESNKPIKELANNPLLLTLLCLEFGDSGDFPSDRAELYNRAIHTLLRKWDAKRNIKRDEVYKNLTVRNKETLLSQVGWNTFERNDYFFKRRDIERYIGDFIRNLPEAKDDLEALQVDSELVLKSIEAQHGILVERATGIYSFSHLTFQEYFSARKIAYSANQKENLQSLVGHITEKRWREVFLLSAAMLENADELLMSMKQQIDVLLADDDKLQQFLIWVEQKSESVETPYKPTAIRALYFDLSLSLSRSLDLSLELNPDLKRSLQQFKDQLPDPKNKEAYEQWWLENGQAWTEQLRSVMIEHRNIGHDWQFSDSQKDLLKQYYDANKLLVDCLNSDCYVSREVRQQIEDTLLLPVEKMT